MVVRWDPFRDLMSIQNDLSRLFDRTLSGEGQGSGRELATGSGMAGSWAPALDVYETEDRIELRLDLPGIDPEDVELTVEDSTLTVSGTREFRREDSEENYRRVERRFGSFTRSLALPATADAERIQASFDKGVLEVRIPKPEQRKPRRVAISVGDRPTTIEAANEN
jgi:HSP20 family protein